MTTGRTRASRWANTPRLIVLALLTLAVAVSAVPFPGAAPIAPASAQEPSASGDEVIVVLEDGADPVQAAQAMGVEVTHIYRHVFSGFAGVMSGTEVGTARFVQPVGDISSNGPVQAESQIVSDNVSRTGIPIENGTNHLDIPSPVDADIAVLDSGIAELSDLDVAGGYNCVGRNEDKWQDDYGHGTHVAGVAAAIDNDEGVVGVAPGARVWSVKVLDDRGLGTFADVICGLDWVVANKETIDVINLSLSGVDDRGNCQKPAFHRAVCAVVKAGIPVVVAAGNQGKNAGIRVPASYPEVITVSAFADSDGRPGSDGPKTCRGNKDDRFLRYSNYGRSVDIAAPGDCILSLGYQGGLQTVSGTSDAAPHVVGALANYIARYVDDHGSRPSAEKSRKWLLSEGSRRQIADGVKGDRDFEKQKKDGIDTRNSGNNSKQTKKSGKAKNKDDGKRERILWLDALDKP